MKRSTSRFLVLGIGASAVLLALPLVASCARSTDEPSNDDAANVIGAPDGSSDGADADGADAAVCDAADPTCVSNALTCTTAAWCPVPTGIDPRFVLTSVWGSSASDVWAVGSGGTVVRYDGTTWRAVATGISETLHAVWGTGPGDVWAVSSFRVLLHSTGMQGGVATFTKVPSVVSPGSSGGRAHAVWGTTTNDVIVGGELFEQFDPDLGDIVSGNHLQRTAGGPDGGAPSWTILQGQDGAWTRATIRAIWGRSASDVWMSADNSGELSWQRGMLLHRGAPDGGKIAPWVAVDSQSAHVLESVWGSAAGDVWAVGAQGTIRHFSPGAARWSITPSLTNADLHGVWGSSPSDVWAVGDDGVILHYDGTAWSLSTAAFPLGPKPNLHGVWGSGPADVWVVGDGITLHFTGPKPGAGADR